MMDRARKTPLSLNLFGWSLLLALLWGLGPVPRTGTLWADQPERTGQTILWIEIRLAPETSAPEQWRTTAEKLIRISPQDPYEPARLARAIERLQASGLFASIHVPDPVDTGRGVGLFFDLVPFGRIKDIRISNSFPLFCQEVLNVMTLHTGDAFSADRLSRQEERIVSLYLRHGFGHPRILVSAQKDPEDGNYTVFVDVKKGEYYQVKQVVFAGNLQVSSARLKSRTRVWRSSILPGSAGRLDQGELDRDVKRLTDFYRKRGFAEVSIQPEVTGKEAGRQVTVVFHIQEGPLYRVRFKGNRHLSASTLVPLLGLASTGNPGKGPLTRGMQKIKSFYGEQGFPDARVSCQDDLSRKDGMPVREVTLHVEEGAFYRVAGMEISGHRRVPETEIRQSILTRKKNLLFNGAYSVRELDADISAVRALYLRRGFSQTRVEKTVKKIRAPELSDQVSVHIGLQIDEGPLTLVKDIRFEGLSVLSPDQAASLLRLTPGQPFRAYLMEQDENSLTARISELGYPHCQVRAKPVFSEDAASVQLVFEVIQGHFARMGQVFFTGNFRTRPSVMTREMQMDADDPFSLKKLLESRKNMLDLTCLDTVRFQTVGLDDPDPQVDLIVSVEEKKPYFFEAGAGYDTERHVYVNSAAGDHNFLGKNLDIQLGAEISQIGYQADLSLTDPRLFSSRVASTTRIFGEKKEEFNKEFGTKTLGISQKFYRHLFSDVLTGRLGITYERREQVLSGATVLESEKMDANGLRHVLTASPGLAFRTTDSYVRPKKGWLSTVDMDVSKGIDDPRDDFIRTRLDTRLYFPLADSLVLALRAGYGRILPYGGNSRVPDDQLFYLGGTASVRGVDENLLRVDGDGEALGGRETLQGTAELRVDLGLNLEGALFYDTGAVQKTQSPGGTDDFRDTAGIGLRYMTPVGPIGFLYGWKLDPLPGESSGNFHFSMGYTF